MNKNHILIVAAILLTGLAVYLFYLGNKASIMPPKLTAIGFTIIAVALLASTGKNK